MEASNFTDNKAVSIPLTDIAESLFEQEFIGVRSSNNRIVENEPEEKDCEELCFVSLAQRSYYKEHPELLPLIQNPSLFESIAATLVITDSTFEKASALVKSFSSTLILSNSSLKSFSTGNTVAIDVTMTKATFSDLTIVDEVTSSLSSFFISVNLDSHLTFKRVTVSNC